MSLAKILFPSVLKFRFDYNRFLKIAIHEGSLYQALLRDRYRVGSSSTVRNALQKLSGVGLLSKPKERRSRRGKRTKQYMLTPKGLLAALLNPGVQAKTEVANFFERIGESHNALMNTLRALNWLTQPKQKRSLLVDLVEGLTKLGWNLEHIDEEELNRRILLLWAAAFAIQGEEDFLRRYSQRIGQPMTDIIVASYLAKKMKSREEFLKDRQLGKQKPDLITEWRLNSAPFIEKYYEVQELLRQRFVRAAQVIPSKHARAHLPQREEVMLAREPLETLVCFQQGELTVHVNYVWPNTVLTILSAFLEGKPIYNFPFPLSIECLAKANDLCIREGTARKCLLNAKSRATECPVLKKRIVELCDRLKTEQSCFRNAERIWSKSDRVNWREGKKKGTYHFHTHIIPFSR